MNRPFLTMLCLLLLVSSAVPLVSQAEQSVHIGVLAKRGDEKTLQRWKPTADYLSAKITGYRFSVVPLDFVEIRKAVANSRVDFVLANSAIYVGLEKDYGVGRIATLRNRNGHHGYTVFGGVIFTRAGRSDINTLADVKGKRFTAVKENSLGGYLMAWRELEDVGITPSEDTRLSFAGTHDAVVYAVLRGRADVGTVRTDTLERMSGEGKIDLSRIKVIHLQNHTGFNYLSSTRLYPEWPIAKLKNTPEALSHDVAAALLQMPADSKAAKAGEIYGWTVPRNYQPVHDLLRQLHVAPYANEGKITLRDLLRNYWYWLLLTLLVLLMLTAAVVYVMRLNIRLREAEAELIDARDNLTDKVRERTAELEETHRRIERISRDWNDAFDAISDPIFIHDSDMCIVQANPAYCERAGHSVEEMQGQPYYHFFPLQERPLPACEIFPEKLQTEGDELVLDSGEVFVSRSFGIRRADNTVVHAIHILEDVTEVRRTEARRRTLSMAVEQAKEGVLILDREKQVVYCNPEFNTLRGREHRDNQCLSGQHGIDSLVQPHFVEDMKALFEVATKGENASAEMELMVESGPARPVFMTISGIYSEERQIDGFVLTLHDLSKMREAEQAITYRIGFESVVAGIASRLVNAELHSVDDEVNDALRRLGEFSGTDRVYLFRYDTATDAISNTHEWTPEGITSYKERLQQIPLGTFPWLRQRLLNGEVVPVADVTAMPEAAQAEQAEFERHEIRSLLLVPLSYGGELAGFIGFDNVAQQRDWLEEDIRLLRVGGEIIVNSLVRFRAMRHLQHSEASLAAAQHIAHLGNWEWNVVTSEVVLSDEIYRIFGLQQGESGTRPESLLDRVHPAERDMVSRAFEQTLADKASLAIDYRIVRPDRSERIVHVVGEVELDEAGAVQRIFGTLQDVTELRQSEREMQRLNRALRTLSLCNTTMVHAENEQQLMHDICHILTDNGGYHYAWVGYAEQNAEKTIRIAANAGIEGHPVTDFALSWAKGAAGNTPAGRAIRNTETVIVRNIDGDTGWYAPWREAALKHGYVSMIALPLISEGEVLGVINIDATESEAFDAAELLLLEEMAGDLAFGIRTLRNRVERDRAESALQQTEERYEELYESAPNAYVSVAAEDGRLLQFNQALCDILGYEREALAGKKVFELYADNANGLQRAKAIFAGFQQGKGTRDAEVQMCHADGHPVWVSVSIDPVTDEQGNIIESRSMVIDISARKRAEEERSHVAEQLQRSLLQAIRAIALTIEKRDPYTAGHQERVAELAVRIGEKIGLNESELEGLRLGALIHDIGKISIPSEILNRPGRLEPEMFNIIKTHPQNGYEIMRGIEFPWPLAEMVLQHHERLDGSGYPKGLTDGDILRESRILAVADVIEAMASHRPYRAALGLEKALAEIERGRGTLYDAQVVDACRAIFRDPDAMLDWVDTVQGH